MGRKPYKWNQLPPRMRKRTRGDKAYYYYDVGGKPRREIPLGSDYVEAIRLWSELEQDDSAKIHCTILDAINKYLAKVLPKKAKRTQLDNLKELAKIKEFFCSPAPAPLAEIKPIHIRQYMDWRTKDGTGFTRANREKALLSHIYNMAREWGMTDANNPCLGIRGYSEKGRKIYVEDVLFDKVFEASTVPVQEAMMIAYLTGQRPADTLKITLSDIRDEALHIEQNKTGHKMAFEITGELKVWIDKIMNRRESLKIHNAQLIVNESGRALNQRVLQDRFRKTRVALGIPLESFQFRDLRAKAGTDKASEAGLDQAKAQLGHKNVRTTEIYVRQRKADRIKPTK